MAVAERRRVLEDLEQANCTFAPSTTGPYQEPNRPVVVSGLDRFFELRGIAQRQQQEQKEREAKLFRPEMRRPPCSGITICEPFVLSKGTRDATPRSRYDGGLSADCYVSSCANDTRRLPGGTLTPRDRSP